MKEDANIVDAEIVDESADKPEQSEETSLKSRLLSAEQWLRFIFMALFVMIACVAAYVLFILIVVQFLFALCTGKDDNRLRGFGYSLSEYFFQIFSFLTYNTNNKPYPFSDWPTVDDE